MPLPFAHVKNPIDRINNMRAHYYARLATRLSRRSREVRQRLVNKDQLRELTDRVMALAAGECDSRVAMMKEAIELDTKLRFAQNVATDSRTTRKVKNLRRTLLIDVFEIDPTVSAVNPTGGRK